MRTILIVDDKPGVRQLIGDYLSEQGYQILEAANGAEALDLVEQKRPDLILLDVMMPKLDGYQVMAKLRKHSNIPTIMVTAKRQEADIVKGFELGADDYIVKPFLMRELLMRVRARLKQTDTQTQADPTQRLDVGRMSLDLQTRTLTLNAKSVDLTEVEYHILEMLMRNAGTAVSRAALSITLIENGFIGSENTIKIHIYHLRQKIEPTPARPSYIETVFGRGYRLKA